jgi:DNA replication and repair protein RecF
MSENYLGISRLYLSDFRNHKEFMYETDQQVVAVVGANGMGKTNILEAISLLIPGRGFRNAAKEELARKGGGGNWAVSAILQTPDGEVKIGTGQNQDSPNEKRIVSINGAVVRSQSALNEWVCVLSLVPYHDRAFQESTTERRQLLDRLCLTVFPDHSRRMGAYAASKSERQNILYMKQPDSIWLSTIEKRMAEEAVAIADTRLQVVNMLQNSMDTSISSFPSASLGFVGDGENLLKAGLSSIQAEKALIEKWASERADDREAGRTNTGAHKGDFRVFHKPAGQWAELCSTGQQKMMLLSLTLAAAEMRRKWRGTAPILLLDEVIAHLDSKHRNLVFEKVSSLNSQVWMTGTDPEIFVGLKHLVVA